MFRGISFVGHTEELRKKADQACSLIDSTI